MTWSVRAHFLDGTSTRGVDVTVTLGPGQRLRIEGPGVEREVAADEVRIDNRLGDTVRALWLDDGAKCEVADNDAVDDLARRLGRGRAGRWRHRLESKLRYALIAAVGSLGLAAAGVVWGIPFTARQVAMQVPDDVAHQMGAGTLDVLDQGLLTPSELDEATQARLREGFAAQAAAYPGLPLRLVFRRLGHLPNAFALPDGTVIVTDELVALAAHDGEVLAVLAHEIGHVHHRHSLRMALESSSVALLVGLYLGDASQFASVLSALPTVYAQASFSREHEREADAFALSFMRETGQSPRDFSAMMRKLGDAGGRDRAGALAWLSSHPPTAERIARFDAAADP